MHKFVGKNDISATYSRAMNWYVVTSRKIHGFYQIMYPWNVNQHCWNLH